MERINLRNIYLKNAGAYQVLDGELSLSIRIGRDFIFICYINEGQFKILLREQYIREIYDFQ